MNKRANLYLNIYSSISLLLGIVCIGYSLTLKELQYLYFGGNKKMLEFMKYEYPKLIKISPVLVYKTVAMEYYRNWLAYLVEGGNKPQKPDMEMAYTLVTR